jgi:hypothetical protein
MFGWRGPEIPLDKPAGTIRIAFVGASTTVGLFDLPFSYPEYVVHWLNLWAERNARRLPSPEVEIAVAGVEDEASPGADDASGPFDNSREHSGMRILL